jgi:hypothetical protein
MLPWIYPVQDPSYIMKFHHIENPSTDAFKEKGAGVGMKSSERAQKRWELIALLTKWVREEYLPGCPGYGGFSFFFNKASRVLRTRGVPGLISFVKELRTQYIRYLSDPDSPVGKMGLKRVLKAFGRQGAPAVLNHSQANIRLVLTALTGTRRFRLPPNVDTKRIEDRSRSPWVLPSTRLVKKFWGSLNKPEDFDLARESRWSKFHMTSRKGPNGFALTTWPLELEVIPTQMIKSLGVVGGKELQTYLEILLENRGHLKAGIESLLPKGNKETILRKVTGIQDREGKTRPVAVFDYFSQTGLRGVHLAIFDILRRIPQDMTFNQRDVSKVVKGWVDVKSYIATDLSKATDRFPRELVCLVLSQSPGITPEWVQCWEYLMTGLPFKEGKKWVTYNTGLPMGGYSCWAAFALAHHFVVFWCCADLGIKWHTAKYIILGDDVLFGDEALGNLYQDRIQALGVEVSLSKSTKSKYFAEFAKRYFYRTPYGEFWEVTPFPASAVAERPRSIPLVVSALYGEERKGLKPYKGIPSAVFSLMRIRRFRRKFCRKAANIAWEIDLMTRALDSQVRVEWAVTQLINANLGTTEDGSLEEYTSDYVRGALKRMVKASWKYEWLPREEKLQEILLAEATEEAPEFSLMEIDPIRTVFRDVLNSSRKEYTGVVSKRYGWESTRILLRGIFLPDSVRDLIATDTQRKFIFAGKLAGSIRKSAEGLDYPRLYRETGTPEVCLDTRQILLEEEILHVSGLLES